MVKKSCSPAIIIMLLWLSGMIYLAKCEDCPPYNEYIIKYQLDIDETAQSYVSRKTQYQSNCRMIHFSNMVNRYELAPVKHMDQSFQDIKKRYGIAPLRFSSNSANTIDNTAIDPSNIKVSSVTLPAAYSLVNLGYISSVKNQDSCGCCWSFAGTAMYESYLKQRGFTYGLSEEAALQCASFYAPGGRVSDCGGGYFQDTLRFFEKVGSILRSNYPYISGDWGPNPGYRNTSGICAQKNRIMVGNGTRKVYSNITALQVKTLLYTEGALMVGVYASSQFMAYKNGIFTGCPATSSFFINHAVLLVGYNDTDGYWLIKNSWDTTWGENGFIKVSYNNDCGISYLLGNVQFTATSYNANPEVVITDSSLLFGNASIPNPAPSPTPTPAPKALFELVTLLKTTICLILISWL